MRLWLHRTAVVVCWGLALVGLAVTGCSDFGPDPAGSTPGGLLETTQSRYDAELRTDGYERWVVDVAYVTRNTTPDTLVLVGCKTPPPPILQKRVDGRWRTAYAPVTQLCLSPPWTIRPGDARRDTLRVSAAVPGQNVAPVLEVEEIEGTYRLKRRMYRKTGAKSPDDAVPPAELLSADKRVSNPFELE